MLLSIYFENFRSFRNPVHFTLQAEASKAKEQNVFTQLINKGETTEEQRLLKSAVIYGANASGKSNLIRGIQDIISFVCDVTITAGEDIVPYTPFLFDTSTNTAPVRFGIEFIGKDHIRFKYEISYTQTQVVSESLTSWPQGKPVNLLQRTVDSAKEESIHSVKFKSHNKQEQLEIFHNQSALSKFGSQQVHEVISDVFIYLHQIEVATPLNSGHTTKDRNNVSKKLMTDQSLMKWMNELLRFADTGLKNIQVVNDETLRIVRLANGKRIINSQSFNIKASHPVYENGIFSGQDAQLPLSEESNGVRTLYTFGGKILSTIQEGGIIFVDELETSLHPYLSKLLVMLFQSERINKKNAQLIFTTHDTNLLERNLFRRDQVWFAQKDDFGVTEFYSLQDFPDVREDTPFDKWYLAGKFGGIPDIKSLETLFEDI